MFPFNLMWTIKYLFDFFFYPECWFCLNRQSVPLVELMESDGVVSYSCRCCKLVPLYRDESVNKHTHSQKTTCHLPTWSGHVPLGMTDPGKRSNLSSSLSCLTCLLFSPLLCSSKSWRAGRVVAAPLSLVFYPSADGLVFFPVATPM